MFLYVLRYLHLHWASYPFHAKLCYCVFTALRSSLFLHDPFVKREPPIVVAAHFPPTPAEYSIVISNKTSPAQSFRAPIQAPKHGVFRGGRAEQDRVSFALLSWSVRTVGCEAAFVHPSSGHYPGMKQLLGRPLMVLNRPGFVLFRGRVYALSSTNQKKVTLL